MTQQDMDTDSGFVDVAANALAIVILITMIALLLAAIPIERGEETMEVPPPLQFPVALDPTLPPLNGYWYAGESGLTRIDLTAAAQGIAAGERKVETTIGDFYFQNDRSSYRDLDEYRLDYRPNLRGIADAAELINDALRPDWVARFAAEFEAERRVPTFFVDPAAYPEFAALYHALRDEGLAFRWRPIKVGQNAVLARRASQFETGSTTWR